MSESEEVDDIYSDLEELSFDEEKQKDYWNERKDEFRSEEEKRSLLLKIKKLGVHKFRKLAYLVVFENMRDKDNFIEHLSLIYTKNNKSWFWESIKKYFDSRPDLAKEIYLKLKERGDLDMSVSHCFLGMTSNDFAREKILSLLSEGNESRVLLGLDGVVKKYKNKIVPNEIIRKIEKLSKDQKYHKDILDVCSLLFKNNRLLWNLSIELCQMYPDLIEEIITRFNVEEEHLDDYLDIIKKCVRCGQRGKFLDIFPNLKNELLVKNATKEHLVFSYEQGLDIHFQSIAKRISRLHDTYYKEVFHYANKNNHCDRRIVNWIFAAGKSYKTEFVIFLIENYEDENRILTLNLLMKLVCEFYQCKEDNQEIAIKIKNFLDNEVQKRGFVRKIRDKTIEKGDERFYHIYKIIEDHLLELNYDGSTLHSLSNFPNLTNKFRSKLNERIKKKEYHPMLYLLDTLEDEDILDLLENHFEWVQEGDFDKKIIDDAEGCHSTLSEITLYIRLRRKGYDVNTEVPFQEDEQRPKGQQPPDVDLKVDDTLIEVYTPRFYRKLEVCNSVRFMPNTAYKKIIGKFERKFKGTNEMEEENIFLALNIMYSEIGKLDIDMAINDLLSLNISYDEEGVETRTVTHKKSESIQIQGDIGKYLNGVIWYQWFIDDSNEVPELHLAGEVIKNPACIKENNDEVCKKLNRMIFG